MLCLVFKNSVNQIILDQVKDDIVKCNHSGGHDGRNLLISVRSVNSHKNDASTIVAKLDLLTLESKNFHNNDQDTEYFFQEKMLRYNFLAKKAQLLASTIQCT